jgi:small subunit ribosomal protein S5
MTFQINKKQKMTMLSHLEFDEIVLEIKRVTKVVKGGKNITFRAVVAVGDKKSRVGIGIGRAEDINLAIQKAILNGKKNIIQIPITKNCSIPYMISNKYGASKVLLLPAKNGTGIIAGGALRAVLEIGGIVNIVGKQLGSQNILNNAKATINALKLLKDKIETTQDISSNKAKFYQLILKKFKINKNI